MFDPFGLLKDILKDAQGRVPTFVIIDIQRMAAEKAKEWEEKGIPKGVIDAALKWARAEAQGWAKRFPEEKRIERLAEVYPSFLRDAEEKYIRSMLRAMYEPDRKAVR